MTRVLFSDLVMTEQICFWKRVAHQHKNCIISTKIIFSFHCNFVEELKNRFIYHKNFFCQSFFFSELK